MKLTTGLFMALLGAFALSLVQAGEQASSPYNPHRSDEAKASVPKSDNSDRKSSFRGKTPPNVAQDGERGLGSRRRGESRGGEGGGSKGRGSKGSSGSKGSKGDNGGGDGGGGGPFCKGCGDKHFAYIHLEGPSMFTQVDFDLNNKVGEVVPVLEYELTGYADYFDHYESDPHSYYINGTVSGSCTVVGTKTVFVDEVEVPSKCILHCTICVSYYGEYCEEPYGDYRELWYKKPECCPIVGFATATGDVVVDLFGGFDFYGQGAVSGGLYDMGDQKPGGLAILEYTGFDKFGNPGFALGLKVPFTDQAVCKLQDYAYSELYGK